MLNSMLQNDDIEHHMHIHVYMTISECIRVMHSTQHMTMNIYMVCCMDIAYCMFYIYPTYHGNRGGITVIFSPPLAKTSYFPLFSCTKQGKI